MSSLPKSVAEVISDHVTLELECIDRMYLNAYVPLLQTPGGVAWYLRQLKGYPYASTAVLAPNTREFVTSIERFSREEGIDLIRFQKGQRKDDVTQEYLSQHDGSEGVLYIGKAQEKARVPRTERRRSERTGKTYPWIIKSTAMVNHYYNYFFDDDFGPGFLKFCSYFPYNAKLCINGHEYLKRQLTKKGIGFEALDNGILNCEDPRRMQRIADGLTDKKIDRLYRKWLRILPHPFSASDRRDGCIYDLSILQAEFALTQILDRPLSGRLFFEQVIRENLDIGRPGQVQLIFNRRVTKRTPGSFRTRVITRDVTPTLHLQYKRSSIHQYHKDGGTGVGQGIRTEATINNTYDFYIGRRLHNLPALREVGFSANRRLLDVERISHDCSIGEDTFREVQSPIVAEGQRAPALRFADSRVQSLFLTLLLFIFVPRGFANRDLRRRMAQLSGKEPGQITPGQMTYDLRRLRLHGIIERIPRTHRYRITEHGLRVAMFFTRVHARIFRPGLSLVMPNAPPESGPKLQRTFEALQNEIISLCDDAKLAS